VLTIIHPHSLINSLDLIAYFRLLLFIAYFGVTTVAVAVTEESLPDAAVAISQSGTASENKPESADPLTTIKGAIDKHIDDAAKKLAVKTGVKPIDSALLKISTLISEATRNASSTALQSREVPDLVNVWRSTEDRLVADGISASAEALRSTGLPFARNLEFEHRIRRGDKPQFSARSIDALYESKNLHHTTFAEAGLARNGDDRTTLNLGFGYRYINKSETWLYGINTFYDRQWPYPHERISLGIEASNLDYDLFANRYVPLTNWVATRTGYEESALGGWDVGISGRVPYIPEMKATGTAFSWEGREDEPESNGLKLGVEYTPFPLMTLAFSTSHDTDGRTATEGRIRINLNADKVKSEQKRKNLRDLRLQRVNRENEILVFERQSSVLTGNVTETVGNNQITLNDGTVLALTIGRKIMYGNVITVENAGGAYAQLVFGDGATLRIGTDSQVRIDLGLITLITGTMQYVSGSTNVIINAPGGTITLLGTDVDLVSNGTTSTVGVRDGQIQSGGVTASAGNVVTLNGATALLAPNDPQVATHRTAIYNRIDSIDASLLTIAKAAPYIYQNAFVQQSPLSVGDNLVIGLRFSKPVTVTGAVTLDFTINGGARTAAFTSGSGSNEILFTYTTVPADAGEDEFVIDEVALNGGSIGGGGLGSVSFLPPLTVSLPGGTIQATNPTVVVSSGATSPTSVSPIPVTLTFSAAVNGLLAGDLTVTNGSAANLQTADNIVYTVDITPTAQGTVGVQVPAAAAQSVVGSFDNEASNAFSIVYDTGAPAGYAVAFTTDPVNAGNYTAAAFQLTGAEVGTTYDYSISSSGGGTAVTGTGTVATATQNFTGLNLTALNDGTLTVSLTLTDALMNVGAAATDTVAKDIVAPTIVSVTPPADGTYDDL
jgi:hypothetical protein